MEIKLEYAITQLVEAMLPRFSCEKILQINLAATYSLYNIDQSEHVNMIFLFQRSKNYTKVLLECREIFFMMQDVSEWRLTSDHDSCWNSDGVGSELNKIDSNLLKKFPDENLRIENIHKFVRFDIISPKVFNGNMIPVDHNDNYGKYKVEVTDGNDKR